MLFWYLWVAAPSILENAASVPFTRQWTVRISKVPKVEISPDAPLVAWSGHDQKTTASEKRLPITTEREVDTNFTSEISSSSDPFRGGKPGLSARLTETSMDDSFIPLNGFQPNPHILAKLARGYNTTGRVIIDRRRPYSTPLTPFYVIIFLKGVSRAHALLRVISKAISVGVYAAGTAIFASTTLITMSVALTVLCLVLGAGIFGRVVAMWMASELMKGGPVLHKAVATEAEAAEYVNEVLAAPDLTCEILGHVIVNGKCIKRYNKWFTWANYIGILAKPYDIAKLGLQ